MSRGGGVILSEDTSLLRDYSRQLPSPPLSLPPHAGLAYTLSSSVVREFQITLVVPDSIHDTNVYADTSNSNSNPGCNDDGKTPEEPEPQPTPQPTSQQQHHKPDAGCITVSLLHSYSTTPSPHYTFACPSSSSTTLTFPISISELPR